MVRLVIPTFDALKGTACTFKTAHHDRTINEYYFAAVDVALAASAAPTYFRAAVVPGRDGASYMDGGVWANSPALVGIIECVHFLGSHLDRIDVLSVGTTEEYVSFVAKGSSGILGWNRGLLDVMVAGQISAAQSQARLLLGHRLHRIDFQANRGEYSLDDARPRTIGKLAELGRSKARTGSIQSVVTDEFLNGKDAVQYVPVRTV